MKEMTMPYPKRSQFDTCSVIAAPWARIVVWLSALLVCLVGISASAATLVEDTFSGATGATPDAAKFDWSGQVTQTGAGQLSLSTDTANTSWIKSKTGAVLAAGDTLVLNFTAYAYAENWNPGVYGDKQPRGLRSGTDANNVVEFYSVSRTTLGLRVRRNGAETLASYSFPAGVDSMHQYSISVTTTSAVFRIDGALAGTLTSNIPTNSLNFHVSTYDGGAGNVPVQVDSMQLSLTNAATGTPPSITSQPVSLTVNVTSNAAFAVTAAGTLPLAYQWRKDGASLVDGGTVSGATTTNLVLANLQTNDAGNYTVVITNAYGSVTSAVASLTVNRLAQTITFEPLSGKRVGDAPFTLGAEASSGLPVIYTSSNPNVVTVSGNNVTITGVGSSTLTASQPGNAIYLPAPGVGQNLVVSGIAPAITVPPANQTANVGFSAYFNVSGTGTAPIFYQWRKDGANLMDGGNVSGATTTHLALNNLQTHRRRELHRAHHQRLGQRDQHRGHPDGAYEPPIGGRGLVVPASGGGHTAYRGNQNRRHALGLGLQCGWPAWRWNHDQPAQPGANWFGNLAIGVSGQRSHRGD